MRNALQEQLLKAGLADEKKARQAQKGKQKRRRQPTASNAPAEDDLARLYAERARVEAAERSRELNRQREEAARRKALNAELKQLIEAQRVARDDGEIAYRFTLRDKVKTVRVNTAQQRQLGAGELAVVTLGGRFELVPRATAEKIRERDERRVVVLNGPDERPVEESDYAGYEVPDDLVW
jgi:hypothetical protein